MVNFELNGNLTLEKYKSLLLKAYILVGNGGRYLVFSDGGYLLRHLYNDILRYWYAAANSRISNRGLLIDSVTDIQNLPRRIIKDIERNADSVAEQRSRSGWEVIYMTNVRFVFVNYF